MKALILAAGKGERFFPFNVFRPKPMFPICNRPLIAWTVSRLIDAKITDIGIVVGHRGGRARNYFGKGQGFGCQITYIEQPQPKGTAHAVGLASDFIGSDDVLVIFGDIFFGPDAIPRLLDVFNATTASGVAGVVHVDDLAAHIRAHVEQDQRVSSYTYKPRAERAAPWPASMFSKTRPCPIWTTPPILSRERNMASFRPKAGKFATSSPCSTEKIARSSQPICPAHGLTWICHGIRKTSRAWPLPKWPRPCPNRSSRPRPPSIPQPAFAAPSQSAKTPPLTEIPPLKGRSGSEKNAQILEGSRIASHTVIGDHCKIGPFAKLSGTVDANCHITYLGELSGIMLEEGRVTHQIQLSGIFGERAEIGAGTQVGTLRFDDAEIEGRSAGHPPKSPRIYRRVVRGLLAHGHWRDDHARAHCWPMCDGGARRCPDKKRAPVQGRARRAATRRN